MFILKLLGQVYKKPGYAILTIVVAGLVLLFSIWLRNSTLIAYVISSELFSWGAKIKILWKTLGSFNTTFTVANRIVILVLTLLGGINISFLVFYLKNKAEVLKMAGTSGLGLVIGFLGIGCGACGSVILTSIFGLTFATGFIGFLPLQGLEFGLLGIVLILISIYLLAKKINQPNICK